MGRTDGFGAELLPERAAFDLVLDHLADYFLVRIGKGAERYPIACDVDLNGNTSVSDLLDLGSVCRGVVAQCSFCVPLAEVFDKPLLAIWAARGMEPARHRYIKQITPQKILSKGTSLHVVDSWALEKIREAVRGFCEL